MRSSYCIGVTGGIASGKSALTQRFEALGIPVIDADIVSRELVEPGQPALQAIVDQFGAEVLTPEGRLNRAALRAVVFNNDSARLTLNEILHPRVHAELIAQSLAITAPYCLVAIPLLAESADRYRWLDRVLVVDIPRALQHQRVMQRDGSDAAHANRILASQASRDARLAIADDVVTNDGPIEALDNIVSRLHSRYLSLAASQKNEGAFNGH